jgi:uncharacterized protein (TIGR02996 family)
MPAFPRNPALEAAVIADTEDDAPRLVYADWLDDHGDADRADFIRVQCRLAASSPTDAEWVDLHEREAELAARLKPRFRDLEPPLPEGYYFGSDFLGAHEEPFRRGFPYFVNRGRLWSGIPEGPALSIATLPELVEKTTLRGLNLHPISAGGLRELFAVPACAHFTGLAVYPQSTTEQDPQTGESEWFTVYRLVADSPAVAGIRHLCLYGHQSSATTAALARSTTLTAVRRLTIQGMVASQDDITALVEAPWFGRLHHFRSHLSSTRAARRMISGLARLPDLHTLELPNFAGAGVPGLAKGAFVSLARLDLSCPLDRETTATLARARFPRLAVLNAGRCLMKNDAFTTLISSKWFGRLLVLNLATNELGDRAATALAASPAGKTLRILRLGDNSFGKGGLAAIARPGAFPELSTLDLGSSLKRKATGADVAAFLSALALPRLRHLNLMGWPLGDAEAKVLAGSPVLAGLTRLDLSYCDVGDRGAQALFASPHLQNLVELRLNNNRIKAAADVLCDSAVMPRLGECWLSGNRIPRAAGEKLRESGRYVVV